MERTCSLIGDLFLHLVSLSSLSLILTFRILFFLYSFMRRLMDGLIKIKLCHAKKKVELSNLHDFFSFVAKRRSPLRFPHTSTRSHLRPRD